MTSYIEAQIAEKKVKKIVKKVKPIKVIDIRFVCVLFILELARKK